MSFNRKTLKGPFVPKNPSKYKGRLDKIVFRSSWELRVFNRCDTDPNVLAWASESIAIPYLDPSTRGPDGGFAKRRYFPDIWVKTAAGCTLMEIKPEAETKPPVRRKGKPLVRVAEESATFVKNVAKWQAAQEFCRLQGWKFVVVTEKQVFG